MLPKGNGKTTLLAAVALHELVMGEQPMVYCGAASVAQARILFEAARRLAEHPTVADRVVVRHLELRRTDGNGVLRMVPADGPRTHGLTPSLMVLDELWAHRDDGLYLSFRSALVKRPDAKLVTLSTADVGADRPLSRLRSRALAAPTVERHGGLTECRGDGLRALLWEADDDPDPDDLRSILRLNPASWIGLEALREQRAALPEGAFLRFHANARVAPEGSWLPPGAWQTCVGEPTFELGERIWIGVDVGGERSATAVIWISESLQVGCSIFEGEEGVLLALDRVRELAAEYLIAELIFDPWRFQQAALELEREGVRCVQFPQTSVRMTPASQRLRDAVVEGRLTLPPDPMLAKHAANAVQRHDRRGWRLDRPSRAPEDAIDGLIALCMALERCEARPEPVRLVGWL